MIAILALSIALQTDAPESRRASDTSSAQREAAEELQFQRRLLQRFARCIVGDYRDLAASLVDLPTSAGEDGAHSLLTSSAGAVERCLSLAQGRSHFGEWIGSAAITGGARLLVGALAEQLYVDRYRHLPAVTPASAAAAEEAGDLAVRVTNSFANCVIDADAAAVDGLVRSQIGTDQERAAFAALSVHFGTCLDRDNSLILNRSTLRAALAEQLYRRTR